MKLRKTTGTIFILFVFILGVISVMLIAFYGEGSYFAYNGYCSQPELSYFVPVEIFELLIICLLISYAIFLETFKSFTRHLQFYKVMFILLLINSFFLVYQIIENPIVLEGQIIGWSEDPANHVKVRYNPLIIFLGLHAGTVTWLNFRFQKKTQQLKMISRIFLIFVLTAIIAVAIVTRNVEYQDCRG